MSLSSLPKDILLYLADYLNDAEVNALCQTNSEIRNLLSTVQRAVDAVSQHWDRIPEAYNIALQAAAEKGNVDLVKLLLKVDGINPNFGDHSKSAPLILAAKNGHSDVVEMLLATANVDPDIRDQYSASPLFYACKNAYESKAYVSIVKQLLNRGDVDLNALAIFHKLPYVNSSTPLIAASEFEVVELLLAEDGIDINACNANGETPLMDAMNGKRAQKIKALLARDDWDPTIVSSDGDHLFPFSVRAGDVAIVKSVLDHPSNIDPNVMNSFTGTALMKACSEGHLDVVQFLLGIEGIDVHRQDNQGRTAFSEAASSGKFEDHSQVVKLFLTRDDIDINQPDHNGRTALFWACDMGHLNTVDLLLEQDGIDPNAREISTGYTPLTRACLNSRIDCVHLLLSHPDTDLNVDDKDGASILALVDQKYSDLDSHLQYLLGSSDALDKCMFALEEGLPEWPSLTEYYLAECAEIRSLLHDAGAIVIGHDTPH
ncbi:Ankyrin repeat-containing domain protein [Elaphomyces granulatus]